MFTLPVSGKQIVLRPLAGEEDLLLAEGAPDRTTAVALLGRLVCGAAGEAVDVAALAVTDVQILLLALHQRLHGADISASLTCRHGDCAAAIAVSFDIVAYLDHHLPKTTPRTEPDEEIGWWRLSGTDIRYRLPTIGDVIAAETAPQAELLLRRRCLAEPDAPSAIRLKAERMMARQAPNLSQVIDATCPDCGRTTPFLFDIESYVMSVLRAEAAFVFRDTHLLALHYHWPEAVILAMPRARRVRHAELLRGAA